MTEPFDPAEYLDRVTAAGQPVVFISGDETPTCPCPGCTTGDPDCPCVGCVADRDADALVADLTRLDRRDYERYVNSVAVELHADLAAVLPSEADWLAGGQRTVALAVKCAGCGSWIINDKREHLDRCAKRGDVL